MTAGGQKPALTVRVERDVYDELVRRQAEFREVHGGRISISDLIKGLLAGRKPVQP